ncbi:unnamed protein product [Closterium sp. Yama58-4]|nr:unnamed protein product [Closterium sp. Yama58-4]
MARKRKTTADTATECPRDLNEIPNIVVASSRVVDDNAYGSDDDDSDFKEYAEGTDDEADSGEEEDKGMSESEDDADGDDAKGDGDEALEETQPEALTTRCGRVKHASAVKSAAKGGEQTHRAPKTRNHILVKRSDWAQLENTTFVAARWFMKDELEPLLKKQGSEYWVHLVSQIEKENLGWVRGVNAVQKQWRNLVCIYKKLKKGEKASGKGAVAKPHWFPYMELFQNNRAVANPHAVDGGGARHVNVPARFAVPCTPPSKRLRVAETATMAAAKLVCKTIKGCHADAMTRLEGLVHAWMQQDERIVHKRLQQTAAAPTTRNDVPADADTQPATNAAKGGDDGWFRRAQSGDAAANPDANEEVWVRGYAE